MTKEEYAKKWPLDEIPDNIRELAVAWGEPFHLFIEDTVKLARDILQATEVYRKEYAAQQSISFAEWIDINGWRRTVGNNPVWINEELSGRSTEQLYNLFLKSLQNNKP